MESKTPSILEGTPRWKPQEAAASVVDDLLQEFLKHSSNINQFSQTLLRQTGTRLGDWVDHFALPYQDALDSRLERAGFQGEDGQGQRVFRHQEGLFPAVRLMATSTSRLAIHVDRVSDFLEAAGLDARTPIDGQPLGAYRQACAWSDGSYQMWVIERHGVTDFQPRNVAPPVALALANCQELFSRRQRRFEDPAEGFEHARRLIEQATAELGVDRACDLFFFAERAYWMRRNHAAQVQYARQQSLGLGWGNHDHHTYRSSRQQFANLISVLELLGFHLRERFYAGREAGWGAQVLEQPQTGVVIFADVDLAADEITGDFSHQGLPERDQLGTVGLWCALHGEAFLEAGMHHLECQFDFHAAVDQLGAQGISSMKPFTDFPYLKQCFTAGELWEVEPARVEVLRRRGAITAEQAERFLADGAMGSHLEILERNQGFQGFNQTGINEIITGTDPRRSTQ